MQSHDTAGPQPWLLWYGILDPHAPFATNATYLAKVNESAVDVPVSWAQPLEAMHPGDSYSSIAKNVGGNFTDAQIRSVRRDYWGAVVEADALFARVLAVAEATGHLNNTIVVFTSDHGEMSMEHRQYLKNSMREPASRVPLIFAGYGQAAGIIPQGLIVTNYTSLVDLMPTLGQLGGAVIPPAVSGHSLSPFFGGGGSAVFPRDHACMEFHSNLANTGVFGIVKAGWKLVVWGNQVYPWLNASAYTAQLFNLQADQYELTDVSAQHPEVVASLHASLVNEWGGRDPQDIDKEAKSLDLATYNQWFISMYGSNSSPQLRKAYEAMYSGFDEADWQRIQQWYSISEMVF